LPPCSWPGGNSEADQRKAFIGFLQDINNRPGIHFLVPTVNDQKALTQQSMVRGRMKNIVYIARELAGSQHGPPSQARW
jgi:hypothetical protein